MLRFAQRDMPDPRTAGVGVRVVTDGKANAFRLRKVTLFNQGAGARSTEALDVLTAKRCMSLPRSGAWNPRNARHVINADSVAIGVVSAPAEIRKTKEKKIIVKSVNVKPNH